MLTDPKDLYHASPLSHISSLSFFLHFHSHLLSLRRLVALVVPRALCVAHCSSKLRVSSDSKKATPARGTLSDDRTLSAYLKTPIYRLSQPHQFLELSRPERLRRWTYLGLKKGVNLCGGTSRTHSRNIPSTLSVSKKTLKIPLQPHLRRGRMRSNSALSSVPKPCRSPQSILSNMYFKPI